MSDIPATFYYILVGNGPLVGPFESKDAAKHWAKVKNFEYKWIDILEHPMYAPLGEADRAIAH